MFFPLFYLVGIAYILLPAGENCRCPNIYKCSSFSLLSPFIPVHIPHRTSTDYGRLVTIRFMNVSFGRACRLPFSLFDTIQVLSFTLASRPSRFATLSFWTDLPSWFRFNSSSITSPSTSPSTPLPLLCPVVLLLLYVKATIAYLAFSFMIPTPASECKHWSQVMALLAKANIVRSHNITPRISARTVWRPGMGSRSI